MKYYSEYTKQMYDTVSELTEAENEAKQEELTKRKQEQQVKEAYDKAAEALTEYLKLKGYEDPDFKIVLKVGGDPKEPRSFEEFVHDFFSR